MIPYTIEEITSGAQADNLVRAATASNICAIDTETNGFFNFIGDRAFMGTFAPNLNEVWATYDAELMANVMGRIEDGHITQAYQNCKFDFHHIRDWSGWQPRGAGGYLDLPLEDTMHGFRVQFPQDFTAELKRASKRFVDDVDIRAPQIAVDAWIKAHRLENRVRVNRKWVLPPVNYQQVPRDIMMPYATLDAYLTLRCHLGLEEDRLTRPRIAELYRAEVQLSALLTHVEMHGWPLNNDLLFERLVQAQHEYETALAAFHTIAPGLNIASPKQLQKLFYEDLGEPIKRRTEKNFPSTDDAALAAMEHREIADAVYLCRKWKRALDKYNELGLYLAPDGAVHSQLKQERARTGRFSSVAPACQNIANYKPDKPFTWTREVFAPRPGTEWLLADYSQIEMRIFAHYSGDEHLLDALRNGVDLHKLAASRMYGIPIADVNAEQRSFGKIMNFTIIYGGGKRHIGESLLYGSAQNDPLNIQEARRALLTFSPYASDALLANPYPALAGELLGTFKRQFPSITAFTKNVQDVVRTRYRQHGYGFIRNVFGREVPVPPEATHKAINYLIQGSAADLIKRAMANSWDACVVYCAEKNWTPWKELSLFFSIHDENLYEVPTGGARDLAKYLTPTLTDWPMFEVPISVDFAVVTEGASWAHKTKITLETASV